MAFPVPWTVSAVFCAPSFLSLALDKYLDISLSVRLRLVPVSSWGLPPLYLPEALSLPSSLLESEFASVTDLSFLILLLLYSWRRKWQPTPVFLPGESHGGGGLQSTDTTERLHFRFHFPPLFHKHMMPQYLVNSCWTFVLFRPLPGFRNLKINALGLCPWGMHSPTRDRNKNSYYQHRDTCQIRAVSSFVRTPHVPREVGEGFSKEGTFKLVPENWFGVNNQTGTGVWFEEAFYA